MFAPKRILVPTDFTIDSDRALREAVDIARAFQSRVYVIHVDRRIQQAGADYALTPSEIAELERQDLRAAVEKMRAEIRELTEEPGVSIELAERHGRTHEEIVGYAKEMDVDLIVIEPHAKSGLLRTLLGGVARSLTYKAPCPVLVLH